MHAVGFGASVLLPSVEGRAIRPGLSSVVFASATGAGGVRGREEQPVMVVEYGEEDPGCGLISAGVAALLAIIVVLRRRRILSTR